MISFANTILSSNSGRKYRYAISVHTTCKGQVTAINVLEHDDHGASPRPYMFLDLLATILPARLYTDGFTVEFGKNPVLHPGPGYTSHPCLVVYERGVQVKRYRLDQRVGTSWPVGIPAAHLRVMVAWWRIHANEVYNSPQEWIITTTAIN